MHWRVSPEVERIVQLALEEDIGTGDISSVVFSDDARTRASFVAKGSGVVAGLPVVEMTFAHLDRQVVLRGHTSDGAVVEPGQEIAHVEGPTRSLLLGERVALNFLQRLSGIASVTRRFVDAVKGFDVTILDTRKTAPGLRVLDKYAVRAGGGANHRFGLYDGVLLKDNHVRAAGGVERAVALIRERLSAPARIEVEVTTLDEVADALRARADIIMLDNMSLADMTAGVKLIDRQALVEASGGITLETVRDVAATGVNWISVGALTHSVKALDISMEVA